jgi:hypothetical protein
LQKKAKLGTLRDSHLAARDQAVAQRELAMGGFSMVHWLIFSAVTVLLFGNRLPSTYVRLRRGRREFKVDLDELLLRYQGRGPNMRKYWNKFLWSSKFWALLGVLGLVSGLYFQRVAANGSGLWCLGLIFLGAAYLEQKE